MLFEKKYLLEFIPHAVQIAETVQIEPLMMRADIRMTSSFLYVQLLHVISYKLSFLISTKDNNFITMKERALRILNYRYLLIVLTYQNRLNPFELFPSSLCHRKK